MKHIKSESLYLSVSITPDIKNIVYQNENDWVSGKVLKRNANTLAVKYGATAHCSVSHTEKHAPQCTAKHTVQMHKK